MQTLNKIAVYTFVIFIVFFIAGIIFMKFHEEEIKKLTIEKINEHIQTKIKTDEIHFSVFEQFPYASLKLPHITIQSSNKNLKEPLLEAAALYLNFNLWEALWGNLTLKEVSVMEGNINLNFDNQGISNFKIFKEFNTKDSKMRILLNYMVFKNINLSYKDMQLKQDFLFQISKLTLSGGFQYEIFDAKLKGSIVANHLFLNNENYTSNTEIELNTILNVNAKKNKYRFTEGGLIINDDLFKINGTVNLKDNSNQINLQLETGEANIKTLLDFMPPSIKNKIENYSVEGMVSQKISIDGYLSPTQNPFISVSGELKNAVIHFKNEDIVFNEVLLNYSLDNGNNHTMTSSKLKIENFKTVLDKKTLKGNFALLNFNHPLITGKINGDMSLKRFSQFLEIENMDISKGEISLNLDYATEISVSDSTNFDNLSLNGDFTLNDGFCKLLEYGWELNNLNGRFLLNGNNMVFLDFSGKIFENDFVLDADLKNVIPYFVEQKGELNLNAKLKSELMDLNQLITKSNNEDKNGSFLNFSNTVNLKVKVNCEKFRFNNFRAENITGDIAINNQIMTFNKIEFASMDGKYYLSGTMDVTAQEQGKVNLNILCKNIDINQLFYQCENFDQEVLTSRHIKGNLTANIDFQAFLTQDFSLAADKVYAKSTLSIENGELINFEPMLALSGYLKMADLKHIRFSTLQNKVEIKDQKIYIPEMDVNSTALDLQVSGYHTFENEVNYLLKIELSEILSKKYKKNIDGMPEIEENEGRSKIYLVMTGSAENPVFTYDKKRVTQKIKHNLIEEKKELKETLKDEFNSILKKETDNKNKGKPLEIEIEPDAKKNKSDSLDTYKNFREKLKELNKDDGK